MSMKTMLAAVAAATVSGLFGATTRYVVPAGTEGNTPTAPYTSWETAANDLATALAEVTAANDVVLVKKGTYYISASITMPAKYRIAVKSYDPDTGTENAAETILDGSNVAEGSSMIATPQYYTYYFRGFTFQNCKGRALDIFGNDKTEVTDCIFKDNGSATDTLWGAAIRNYCSVGTKITRCVFRNNVSAGCGGAIYDIQNSGAANYATVSDCTFENNTAGDGRYGGAIYADRCIHISGCTFKDNKVTSNGQGGHLMAGTYSQIAGCTFSGTSKATYGEAVFLGDNTTMTDCTFTGMSVSGSYGCVTYNKASCGTMERCSFTNNVSIPDSMVLLLQNTGGITFRNCLFANDAPAKRVLSSHDCGGETTVENCTFAGAADSKIIGYLNAYSTNRFVNCILQGTMAANSGKNVSYVENCLTTDPDFVSSGNGVYRLKSTSDGIDAGASLSWHSGSTDLAGNARVAGTAADIGCYEWKEGDFDYPFVVRVVATAEEKTGEWADAYTDLQAAIDAAKDESLITVRSGTYALAETVTISNRTLDIVSCDANTGKPNPATAILDGGSANRIMFAHNGDVVQSGFYDIPAAQHPVKIEGFTFKDGAATGNGGGLLMYGRAAASGKVPSSVVNCRFENCTASVNGGGAALVGGILTNCTFSGCTAPNGTGGGAAFLQGDTSTSRSVNYDYSCTWYSPAAIGCTFANNSAKTLGGGLAMTTSQYGGQNVYVTDCAFTGNTVSAGDAGMGSGASGGRGSTIARCTFTGNSGASYGAMNVWDYNAVSDCSLSGNTAKYGIIYSVHTETGSSFERCRIDGENPFRGFGTFRNCLFTSGAVCLLGDKVTVTFDNCTFAGNADSAIKFQLRVNSDYALILRNSILYRNGDVELIAVNEENKDQVQVTASNCCFSKLPADTYASLYTLTDTAVYNPVFTDPANGDWTIKRSSACRDRGVMLDWMTAETKDLAGNRRVMKYDKNLTEDPTALPDLGCYENGEMLHPFVISIR